MPITLPKQRKMPERIKRHIALRELAREQAGDEGKTLSRAQAKKRAKELETETLPHTQDFWKTKILPGYE